MRIFANLCSAIHPPLYIVVFPIKTRISFAGRLKPRMIHTFRLFIAERRRGKGAVGAGGAGRAPCRSRSRPTLSDGPERPKAGAGRKRTPGGITTSAARRRQDTPRGAAERDPPERQGAAGERRERPPEGRRPGETEAGGGPRPREARSARQGAVGAGEAGRAPGGQDGAPSQGAGGRPEPGRRAPPARAPQCPRPIKERPAGESTAGRRRTGRPRRTASVAGTPGRRWRAGADERAAHTDKCWRPFSGRPTTQQAQASPCGRGSAGPVSYGFILCCCLDLLHTQKRLVLASNRPPIPLLPRVGCGFAGGKPL